MKLGTARGAYYDYSGKTSDIARQLSLAGIAVVWLFSVYSDGTLQIPKTLVTAVLFFISSLAFDLLQYLIATAFWGRHARQHEEVTRDGQKTILDDDEEIPFPTKKINRPTITCFVIKILFVFLGYALLIAGLRPKVTPA